MHDHDLQIVQRHGQYEHVLFAEDEDPFHDLSVKTIHGDGEGPSQQQTDRAGVDAHIVRLGEIDLDNLIKLAPLFALVLARSIHFLVVATRPRQHLGVAG